MKIHCKYDELVKTGDLKLSVDNPNLHSSEQIKRIAKTIKIHGWRHPIIVSKRDGMVKAGHGRIEAAIYNKWDSVPVAYQDFKSEDEEYAFMVADNALSNGSRLDLEMINMKIPEFDGMNFDTDAFGIANFSIDASDKIEIKEKKKSTCPQCGFEK